MREPRLERDRQQWIFDYIVQETGKVFHWDEDGRTLPRSVKSHAQISKHLGKLAQRLERFRQDFSEVTWQVQPAALTSDGRPTLSLRVRGAAESEGLSYSLEASEQIAIRLDGGELVEQELELMDSEAKQLRVQVTLHAAFPCCPTLNFWRKARPLVILRPLTGC